MRRAGKHNPALTHQTKAKSRAGSNWSTKLQDPVRADTGVDTEDAHTSLCRREQCVALLIKDFAIALDRKEPGRRNNSFLRQILGIQNFLRPTCRLLTGATKAAEHNVSYALLSQANLTDKNGRCLFEHHFRNPGSNGTVVSCWPWLHGMQKCTATMPARLRD